MKQQRNTHQRQLVLDAVKARHDHLSADQIYLDVRALDPKISRGTVYRNLSVLVQQGEVLQVKLPHMDRFEWHAERHYHLICQECGAVCDAPLPYDDQLDEKVAKETGFIINRHRIVFEGLCTECQRKQPETK
ncbi:MAG TPA: transcriptional repressor [Anaerolineaceae bacterium]|nr:transcriptional repressor [Anaerolineaceae bacterium]